MNQHEMDKQDSELQAKLKELAGEFVPSIMALITRDDEVADLEVEHMFIDFHARIDEDFRAILPRTAAHPIEKYEMEYSLRQLKDHMHDPMFLVISAVMNSEEDVAHHLGFVYLQNIRHARLDMVIAWCGLEMYNSLGLNFSEWAKEIDLLQQESKEGPTAAQEIILAMRNTKNLSTLRQCLIDIYHKYQSSLARH